MPTIIKLENAFNKLLPDNMEVKFDTKSFVRGDIKTQAEVAEVLIKNRIMSHEESRIMFELPPTNPEHTFVIQSNNYVWGTTADAEEHSRLNAETARATLESTVKPEEDPQDIEEGEVDDDSTED